MAGGLGTASIIPLVLIIAFLTVQRSEVRKVAAAPLTVMLIPLPSTPKQAPAKEQPPRPVEKQVTPVQPHHVTVVPPPIILIPKQPSQAAAVARPPADPKPIEAAPAPIPAPPAPATPRPPSAASQGPDRWEGRVLARLERFRHYPPEAQHARVQGTAVIRFRVDRSGHVLAFSLERSSGNAALDQAALETLRRADPLPKIPAARPDQVELVVPIEFSIAR